MSTIDLSQLPPPAVVEPLDYEALLSRRKVQLVALHPAAAEVIDLESEPLVKQLEEGAYAELHLRARINDAARACMLAYATGADLAHLAALLGVTRLLVTPGDPGVNPPILPAYESDERLRLRTQMALEGFTVAGSRGAYVFHALSAAARVRDVAVASPAPGQVQVTVLAADNGGMPDAALLAQVANHLSADDVRPLTDQVSIEPAEIVTYQVHAVLTLYHGPAEAPVLADARATTEAFVAEHFRLGHDIPLSALFARLHVPGVQRVTLESPAADLVVATHQAARCDGIVITIGGRDV